MRTSPEILTAPNLQKDDARAARDLTAGRPTPSRPEGPREPLWTRFGELEGAGGAGRRGGSQRPKCDRGGFGGAGGWRVVGYTPKRHLVLPI